MVAKKNKQQGSTDKDTLRKAVTTYLECRQAAADAIQWRDWDSVEDLEQEERDALVALERLVGWETPDDDPDAFWNEEDDDEDDDVFLESGSDNSDIDPAVVASIELVASQTYPDGMVYRECGCTHGVTTNRYRLCSYHEGYAEGVEAGRRTAFAEPGTVDWSKRKPFPEGHVGVESVTAEEVEKFLDLIRPVNDAREGGNEAENELLWELLGMVAARTEFFINPVGGPLFDSNGEQVIDENTGVDDSMWVEIPVNLFNVLRKINERMGGDG